MRRARWVAEATQEGTAARADLTVRVLAELERGTGSPTARTLFRIAEALKTTVSALTSTDSAPTSIELRAPKRGRKVKPKRFAAKR